MRKVDKYANLVAVFGPVLVLIALLPVAINHDLLAWSDLIVFTVMYIVCGLGIGNGHPLPNLPHQRLQVEPCRKEGQPMVALGGAGCWRDVAWRGVLRMHTVQLASALH